MRDQFLITTRDFCFVESALAPPDQLRQHPVQQSVTPDSLVPYNRKYVKQDQANSEFRQRDVNDCALGDGILIVACAFRHHHVMFLMMRTGRHNPKKTKSLDHADIALLHCNHHDGTIFN